MRLENVCPYCGYKTDQTELLNDDGRLKKNVKPRNKSLNLCINCGQISIYNDGLYLRKSTMKDMEEVRKEDPKAFDLMLKAVIAWKLVSKRRKKNDL